MPLPALTTAHHVTVSNLCAVPPPLGTACLTYA